MKLNEKFKTVTDFVQYISSNITNFNTESPFIQEIYNKYAFYTLPTYKTQILKHICKNILGLKGRNSTVIYWKTRLWDKPEEKLKQRQSKSSNVAITSGSHKGRFSKEWFITKYGKELGPIKHKELLLSRSTANKKENQIKKNGEEFYTNSMKNRNNTLDAFIKRHGQKEGTEKYYKFAQKSINIKENFINRHGETEGTAKWEEYLEKLKHMHTEEGWTERYGDDGVRKRNEFLRNTILKNTTKFSKKSISLFDNITEILGIKAHYGEDEKAILLTSGRWVRPDFIYKHKIIEFYGDYWHCNPAIYSRNEFVKFPSHVYLMAETKWESDKKRINDIESEGFSVLIVWEYDYTHNYNLIQNRCTEFLSNTL